MDLEESEIVDTLDLNLLPDSNSEPGAKKNLLLAFEGVRSLNSRVTALPPRPPKNVVSLPIALSAADNPTPLVMNIVRRSPRLNRYDGYQHCQYTTRKRSKKSVANASSDQPRPIEAMPDLSGQELGPIPMQVLQSWGVDCGLPSEMTSKEALLQDPSKDVN